MDSEATKRTMAKAERLDTIYTFGFILAIDGYEPEEILIAQIERCRELGIEIHGDGERPN